MDVPSKSNMVEYYVLKYQINDLDTSTYMEDLLGEHLYE